MKRVNYQFVTIILFIVVLLLSIFFFHRFLSKPLLSEPQAAQTIKIYKNEKLWSLAKELHKRHLIGHSWIFVLYAKWNGYDRILKVGEYAIEPNMKPAKLLKNIVEGRVVVHRIRFVEGWTFKEFRNALKEEPLLHTIQNDTDTEIMKELGSQYHDAEGLFFPDTYEFVWEDRDVDILKRAYNRMEAVLNFEWAHRTKSLPYRNSYQALIVASLIEAEAKVDDEREKIAGVIVRRLQKWMHLQIDAAINYGLGYPYGQKLTKADLKKDTPYNTYLHYRFPPTPICMPSKKSIHAALHPAADDAMYYVATGDGRHKFSKNYIAQKKAVKIYQLDTKKS